MPASAVSREGTGSSRSPPWRWKPWPASAAMAARQVGIPFSTVHSVMLYAASQFQMSRCRVGVWLVICACHDLDRHAREAFGCRWPGGCSPSRGGGVAAATG